MVGPCAAGVQRRLSICGFPATALLSERGAPFPLYAVERDVEAAGAALV